MPVLALDLQPEDRVLDMCAAPGGKSLLAIQTLLPANVVMNDKLPSRLERVKQVIATYVSKIGQWDQKILLSLKDGRIIDDKNVFNKVSLFESKHSRVTFIKSFFHF